MFKFNELTINFTPPLTDKEFEFIKPLSIGKKIKDQESFKKLLHHMFFKERLRKSDT
jgi:hypothetical protein